VATQGNNKSRSFVWEDDAPVEPRFRRAQPGTPFTPSARRSAPNLPLDIEDDDGGPAGPRKARFDAPQTPWWRPKGKLGRIVLATGAALVLSTFAYAYHLTKSFLEHDGRFRISSTSNIQSTGLTEVSRADMLPVCGEDCGRNIFFVPLAQRQKELEQIPWVQHATVMRYLPDQIRVSVVERQPVAFVRHGQQIGLVDANGVLLSMPAGMMAQHHYSFPVLTGIDAGDPLSSRKARMDLYERLIEELDASGQHLSEQISEIDLTDPEDARVMMPEQGMDILAHFGEDHFLDRYQRYKAHIEEWRQQYPKLAAVDLRYDQQVVLQMQQGGGTEQAALNGGDAKPSAGQPVAAAKGPDAKPAPVKVAKVETAKPVTQTAAKEHLAESKKADAKPVMQARVQKPASKPEAKTVASTKTQKAHATTTAKNEPKTAAQKAKEERVKALAAKMRDKKRAQMQRAALSKNKPKTAAKPHASVPAGQGQ